MYNLSTTFILRTTKKNKQGTCPIYLRITVNGKRREISTRKYVTESQWDSEAQKVKGLSHSKLINCTLQRLKKKVLEAETQLLKQDKSVTATAIKELLKGETKKSVDLVEFFNEHNEKMEQLIGSEYARATYKKYRTCLKHIKKFLRKKYSKSSFRASDVNLSFIKDFEHFLKTKKNPCSHNSTLKYISHLKKVIREAQERDLISNEPFKRFKETYNDKDPVYLTQQELQAVEEKKIKTPRVDRVRDVYLFCCYTGLSYSDVEKLTWENIDTDREGEQWLSVNRTKTKEPCQILLLPVPIHLIDKYKNSPLTDTGNLLPVISNQKTNAYLKEVAGLCGIEKHVTFHSARHTFATTVALENGVPRETVQKILGHKDSRSTQRYARVTRRKVGNEMKSLRENIS